MFVDVFSRLMHTEFLRTKEAEEVTAAFRNIQRVARGKHKGKTNVIPREISTDTGAEFTLFFGDARESDRATL